MTDECEDDYSEESSKEQCSSPGEADSCQMQSRKKRRGIIEKRRRDRINTSLSDLRRLVPAACEKQGSAKLEKAEILQMTVDYLKMLHTKGHSAMVCDPSKFAMDYHNIGYQECIAEVNKQLSVEGLDLQDPLRMRLMSHLQSVSAQRGWYPSAGPPPPPPPPNASQLYQSCSPLSPHVPRHPPPPSLPLPSAPLSSYHNASLNSSSSSLEMSNSTSLNSSASHSHSLNSSYESSTNSGSGVSCEPTPTSSTQSSTSANTIRPLTTISSTADGYHYLHHNVHQHSSLDLYHSQHLHQQHPYGQAPTDPSVSKQPYRPWGTECAY